MPRQHERGKKQRCQNRPLHFAASCLIEPQRPQRARRFFKTTTTRRHDGDERKSRLLSSSFSLRRVVVSLWLIKNIFALFAAFAVDSKIPFLIPPALPR